MTAPAQLEPAYGFAQAAEKLQALGYRITESWLREHIGAVPHIKVGRDVKFTDSLLAEFLEQQTKRPQSRTSGPAGGRRRRSA